MPNKWGICTECYSRSLLLGEEPIYTPTTKQLEYHSRTEPNVLFWGGRGSGKSMCGRWDAHMRALTYPGFKYCILRRNFPELEKSHLMEVPNEMVKLGGYYHATSHIAHYPNGSTGFFSHCSTDQHVLNLLSAEFHLMFFDEISTFEWEMFVKLAASVRVKKGSGLIGMVRAATNPLGVSADKINRYWVMRDVEPEEDPDYVPSDWYNIHANVDSNPHVDQEQYRKRFGVGMPAHVRKAWVDGEFGLENALFDVIPTKTVEGKKYPYHYLPEIDLGGLVKHAQIYRAFDMGYFPDPAYCIWIAHLGHRYIAFHEKVWYKTVVSDIAEDIKLEDEMLGVDRVVITYCDPTIDIKTGQDVRTMKDIFEDHGIPMECSVNNREHFAAAIHQALYEVAEPANPELGTIEIPRIQIYTDNRYRGCPYLSKTLPLQRYDPKHPLRLADHPDDHAAVSLAYFLISSGSMEKSKIVAPQRARRWMREKTGNRVILGSESVRDHQNRY